MLVKLHDYNNDGKIDRANAYKAPNGYYYSSEQAYTETIQREALRKKCIDKMYELMEYKDFMKMPTIFFKKLKEWEAYGYNVVYAAMRLSEDAAQQAIRTKDFASELNKVSYLSAIIQNKLNDAFKAETRNAKIASDSPKMEIDNIENIGRKSQSTSSVADLLGGV